MSFKGRGFLFNLDSDKASSSTSGTDSGLGSRSELKYIGRGKLINNLIETSCINANICSGRGRGRALNLLTNDSLPLSQSWNESGIAHLEQVTVGGRGKATSEIENTSVSKFFQSVKTTSGSTGKAVNLASNYIKLKSDPNKGVFVYEVRFNPNVDSIHLRGKYLNEHRNKFGGTKTFDGVTLFLPILLKDKLTTYISKSVSDGSDIEIRILFKRREAAKDCAPLYNILFDRIMKILNYVRFDRKQFDPTAPMIIPLHKLEVWPGYVTAVEEFKGGLLLCCDVSHRVLCQKTVLEMFVEIYNGSRVNFQDVAKRTLLGAVILTRYNNHTYRIDDIAFEKNPQSTFISNDGEISFIDYYRSNYNIEIIDKNQPLLISIKKQRKNRSSQEEDVVFCLVPELCYLTGLRDYMRSDHRLMREVATFTRITPNQRMLAIEKFYTSINECKEATQILSDWGLQLMQRCETITGRLLDEEKVYFAQNSFNVGINADFSKYVSKNEMLEVVPMVNWLLIYCKFDTRVAKTFVENLEKSSHALGIKIYKPRLAVLPNDRVETYVNALRQNISKETEIVVCISPNSRDDRYAAIKKVCCSEMPIPSQVINAKTLQNEIKNRSIVQKIALQMNCKLGGSLWSIRIPLKNVMIIGIDVYHEGLKKENSVAALVASLNQPCTKWYSRAVIQSKQEEILSGLCAGLISALGAYHKENKTYPGNVIIFRDGVGDGQLQLCENYEIPQLEKACIMQLGYVIKITFIVVQKRINTRFFMSNGRSHENPCAGTVVDKTITRANLYDFFLVSQSVRQGTVTPTHYVVLRDDGAYNPDIIQRLTYKLCFLYYNWSGTIRIPACCQYAHKMAYLVGQSIKRPTAEELSTKLFYL